MPEHRERPRRRHSRFLKLNLSAFRAASFFSREYHIRVPARLPRGLGLIGIIKTPIGDAATAGEYTSISREAESLSGLEGQGASAKAIMGRRALTSAEIQWLRRVPDRVPWPTRCQE